MIQDVMIGDLLCSPALLFAYNDEDWEKNEKLIILWRD